MRLFHLVQVARNTACFTLKKQQFSSLIFVVVINTTTHSHVASRGFVWFTHPNHSPSLREVREGTKAGAESETMEESSLLSSSLRSAQFTFLYSQAYLPRDGTTLYGLEPLHNKEMAHQHAHLPI